MRYVRTPERIRSGTLAAGNFPTILAYIAGRLPPVTVTREAMDNFFMGFDNVDQVARTISVTVRFIV